MIICLFTFGEIHGQGTDYIQTKEVNSVLYMWTGLNWHTADGMYQNTGTIIVSETDSTGEYFQVVTDGEKHVSVLSDYEIVLKEGTILEAQDNSSIKVDIGLSKQICFSLQGIEVENFYINNGITQSGPFPSTMFQESPYCQNVAINTEGNSILTLSILESKTVAAEDIQIISNSNNEISVLSGGTPVSTKMYTVSGNTVYFTGGSYPLNVGYGFRLSGYKQPYLDVSRNEFVVNLTKDGEDIPIESGMNLVLQIEDLDDNVIASISQTKENGALVWNASDASTGNYFYKLLMGGELLLKGTLIKKY